MKSGQLWHGITSDGLLLFSLDNRTTSMTNWGANCRSSETLLPRSNFLPLFFWVFLAVKTLRDLPLAGRWRLASPWFTRTALSHRIIFNNLLIINLYNILLLVIILYDIPRFLSFQPPPGHSGSWWIPCFAAASSPETGRRVHEIWKPGLSEELPTCRKKKAYVCQSNHSQHRYDNKFLCRLVADLIPIQAYSGMTLTAAKSRTGR